MIKKLCCLTISLFTLVGCGTSEKFETVSVRIENVSCSENIRMDNAGRTSVRYQSNNGLDVDLTAPSIVSDTDFTFSKRCQDILEAAIIQAKHLAEQTVIETEIMRSGAPIDIELNNQELNAINGDGNLFNEDF